MSLSTVTAVEALPDFHARIAFADGFVAEIDLAPALRGPAFANLRDESAFREMRVSFATICWPNGADISPETLRFWCERGQVIDDAETEEYFADSTAARVAEKP